MKTENYAKHHECETSRARSEVRDCIVWSQKYKEMKNGKLCKASRM